MRSHAPELLDVIKGGGLFRRKVADLYYGTERRAQNIPLVNPRLEWVGGDQIQGRGSVTVVWQGDFADSIVPRRLGDLYAPFGATLNVREIFKVGNAEWEVPLGWFPIVDVPAAHDQQMMWQRRAITVGSQVELTLQDRMSEAKADPFDIPTTPKTLTSAIDEAARITRFQVTRDPAVPDAPIRKTVVYEEDRLDALYDLCRVVLDAVPYMTSDGTMSFRPNVWPAPVDDLVYGPEGVVRSIGHSMSADSVKNYIVVRSYGGDDASVLYSTWIDGGPLRVYNPDGSYAPARARKAFLSSQLVETRAQAKEWADRELAQQARLTATDVQVVVPYNPLYEPGDVLSIRNSYDHTRMLCRINTIALEASGADMTLGVEVAAE